jgi:putative FmdB family regulatory protein
VPIYEYRCTACRSRFEEYLPLSTSPPPPCPDCAAASPERLLSRFATEWLPSNVNWHRLPGRHDLPGGDTSKPSAAIPRDV